MASLPAYYRIEDEESFTDFQNALEDYAPRIAHLLSALRQTPGDTGLLGELMRLLHTIKGDAGLCRLGFLVPLLHGMEDVLVRVRSGELQFGYNIEQVLFLALDRLELLMQTLELHSEAALADFHLLCHELAQVAQTPPAALDGAIAHLIESVTGYKPVMPYQADAGADPRSASQRDDLRLFHQLAMQFEQRSLLFQGRTERNLLLARACNEAAGFAVNPLQLEAAIYLHDLGMMFLPEALWLKQGRLSEEERVQLAHHPQWGADLLARMTGWEEATLMVRQHHERLDGKGYPAGLGGDSICDGARLIAIVDAFEAVILKHSQRQQARSLLRAVAELNACESQFDRRWIGHFNAVVHQRIASGEGLPHIR